jgi:diguanylate cyclase (GGDEF)-like protein
MSVTQRIAVLFIGGGLLFVGIATGYIAQREYQFSLQELVNDAQLRTQNSAELQLYFHQQNETELEQFLSVLAQPDAVDSAAAFSNVGELLAASDERSSQAASPESLNSFRGDAPVTDITLTAYDSDQLQSGTGFWSSLTASSPTVHLVIPVLSSLDSLNKNPTLADIVSAAKARGDNTSLTVVGYVHLAIDRDVLLSNTQSLVIRAAFASLLFFLLVTVAVLLAVKRTFSRLNQLSKFAGNILSGESQAALNLVPGEEFINIAKVLHDAATSASNSRNEEQLEYKLLKMQAEERASRLSQRELELNNATIEISSAKEQLHQLANYDSLTLLPNRHLFSEQLSVLLRQSARTAKSLAVLFLNFSNLQRVNESLGRNTGDMILKEIGGRLVSCLRTTDMLSHYEESAEALNVTRLGGGEFAVVLSQLDNVDTAGLVAERLIAILVEPMQLDGHEVVITPRIGISVAPRDGMDVESLLKAAGTALDNAKSESEVSYLFYHETMEGSGEAELKMESELRKAIERNQLRLHFQPQVDTSNGAIVCAEALLRWEHPNYGLVSPAKFIGMAEKIGLIWQIGDWALVEACRQMRLFGEQNLKLPRVAINISPQQFKPAFVSRVVEVLESSGLAPSMLELGLSEAILMDHDHDVLKFLQELKSIGVYLSLENFGTLHAPLNYLSRYPLDEIKIDRSFVADCDKRRDAARLVKAIIAMANSLGLRTVAEGVETEGEYRFLVSNGVSVMRGYLFSKPVPASELRKQLVVPWHFMSQLQRMALLDEIKSNQDS